MTLNCRTQDVSSWPAPDRYRGIETSDSFWEAAGSAGDPKRSVEVTESSRSTFDKESWSGLPKQFVSPQSVAALRPAELMNFVCAEALVDRY
jgi:hypothetical protein